MSLIYSPSSDSCQYLDTPLFTEVETLSLAKQRIIQRNLVHFHGFPDRLYDKEILYSKEYFGQYGVILKIILTYKFEKGTNKRLNSAYITFSSNEEAAYAILAVDSIKIDNMLVRAFFGTTKYCQHFLNNYQCFNLDKCIFMHELADPCDIIENSKFGYSEHIKLAKKIIKFGSEESQIYVMNNSNREKSILPNLFTIYQKKDVLMKTKNHRKMKEKNSNNISDLDTRISTVSSTSNNELINMKKEVMINSSNNKEENNSKLFKSRNQSRFEFAINHQNKENKNEKNYVSKIMRNVVDKLTSRLSFFMPFNKQIPIKILEIEFCNKLYEQTKNNELKNIITNSM